MVGSQAMFAVLAMACVAVTPVSHAFSKCVDSRGQMTFTDSTCSRFGRPVGMRVGGMSYSSREVTNASNAYATSMATAREQREAVDAAHNAQAAAQAQAQRNAAAVEASKRAAAASVPMAFDHRSYQVMPRPR